MTGPEPKIGKRASWWVWLGSTVLLAVPIAGGVRGLSG